MQVPVLVHPAADAHLFHLIGAFWFVQSARSHLIEEVVHIERVKDDRPPELVACALKSAEMMLADAKALSDQLAMILATILGADVFASGEFLSWYRTVSDLLDVRDAPE